MSIKDWMSFNEELNKFDDYFYSSKSKDYDRDGFLLDFKSLISDYESEDEDGLGWTMIDLLSEVGDLCNKWNVNSDHLKELIDSGEDKYNVLSQLYDETLQSEAENDLESELRNWADKSPDERKFVFLSELLGETIYALSEAPFGAIDKDFYEKYVNGDEEYSEEMILAFKDHIEYILESLNIKK
jgi:hypothetical protein